MADVNAISDGLLRLAERMKTPATPTLDEMIHHYVVAIVGLHRGNRTRAAAALGITIGTVSRWMKWEPTNAR